MDKYKISRVFYLRFYVKKNKICSFLIIFIERVTENIKFVYIVKYVNVSRAVQPSTSDGN